MAMELVVGTVGVIIIVLLVRAFMATARESRAPVTAAPSETEDLYALARQLSDAYQATAHPADAVRNEAFAAAAKNVAAGTRYANEELIRYAIGDNATLSSLAVEALSQRHAAAAEIRTLLLSHINGIGAPWSRYIALRALHALNPSPAPLVLDVLAHLDHEWTEGYDRYTPQFVRDFVQLRLREGEKPEITSELTAKMSESIYRGLAILEPKTAAGLKEIVERAGGSRVDTAWLETIGTVWKSDPPIDIVDHIALTRGVKEIESNLTAERRRSVVLVGEPGVGKTTLIRRAALTMQERGWTIFETGANELLAGQIFFGQFEERIQSLARQLRGRRVLWVVKDLPALLYAGRHQHSPTGALDVLMPALQSGEIVLISAMEPPAYEKFIQERPRLGQVFLPYRIRELGGEETLTLGRKWADLHRLDPETVLLSEQTLREARQLALHYLGAKASPGNLLELLKLTRERVQSILEEASSEPVVNVEHVLDTLSSLTGLPATILDERRGLDLEALRTRFAERVLGQPEAVDVLVERVAMIKAGLTDPTRPFGVFLFAGPTGTGKTEIVKVLAEFLFGSANRMIRIDMSELQTSESLSRLIGDADATVAGASLVEQISRQPFSIVLFDELEKAHPNVWDLFLQLFDDGRLTDRRGTTADFRHALIILTSNVGAAIQTVGRMGFSREADEFNAGSVRAALDKQFRKELLNRIDRVVVFRPLTRETMRRILKKELDDLYQRRGLRNRPWATEWDSSAIDFLLEKGFTPDLGARPLKRAIEQYVLSPLALSIVGHALPEGEQFIYVRSDGQRLLIDFVDAEPREPETRASQVSLDRSLQEVVLDPRGNSEDLALLEDAYENIQRVVGGEEWQRKKEIELSMTSLPEFWQSADRFSILTKAEYRDRIEAGLETAGSLLSRLRRKTTTTDVVGRLAQQLFLLQTAIGAMRTDLPWEAFLHIDAGSDATELAALIGTMYRGWAKRRGMRVDVLVDEACEQLLAVSGFGAYSLLAAEQGIHVLELPRGENLGRQQVRVRVAPQPMQPLPRTPTAVRAQARDLLRNGSTLEIVRRYREHPSPLVRDAVRNWRSGRLDLVLQGNFDVM